MSALNTTLPLVSCIMPTYNRRAFLPHAIRYFLRQDYPNKELIIIDDGTDCIEDLVPDDPSVRYYRLPDKITLGAKLNLACTYASGNIIANWDDDDWYAPHRLNYQVEALQDDGTYICGINKLLYYDLNRKNAFQYIYPPDQRTWLLGSSLCYKKEFWSKNLFADINIGMDGLFVWRTTSDHIRVLADPTFSVHMIHDSNVSPKKTNGGWWHGYPVEEIRRIMDHDWSLYQGHSDDVLFPAVKEHRQKENSISHTQKVLKNVFACLVHESVECVIDLVRNLHYHDPSSIILLYNGGENPGLPGTHFPFHEFGAVIYPNPQQMKHGYLHNFALDCMRFALDNFDFDLLTIVDSDQLCVRGGYSDFISSFLSDKPGVGLLSSNPERIAAGAGYNHVAIKALRELDLWKPFLQLFPDGESKFVHWTFWPSTVFTADAARDLVKLFGENKLLQTIMCQTQIWATEEIILPTLVRLLGYDVVLNPCAHDLVKYQVSYTNQEIDRALKKEDIYWVHPVPRKPEDPLRSVLRNRFNKYSRDSKQENLRQNSDDLLVEKPKLINAIRKIEGWLSDKEADALFATLLSLADRKLPGLINVVEIGSYHGKATVLFGSIVRNWCPGARVYAIDMHDGRLGAEDQGLRVYPPSFEQFHKNIASAGLTDVIEIIRDKVCNVHLNKPVSLLFVDGLHDYANVYADFFHFSEWIVPGGYVAFHDYAGYFPGVMKFVNELLQSGAFRKIQHVDSLVVLEKLHGSDTVN